MEGGIQVGQDQLRDSGLGGGSGGLGGSAVPPVSGNLFLGFSAEDLVDQHRGPLGRLGNSGAETGIAGEYH